MLLGTGLAADGLSGRQRLSIPPASCCMTAVARHDKRLADFDEEPGERSCGPACSGPSVTSRGCSPCPVHLIPSGFLGFNRLVPRSSGRDGLLFRPAIPRRDCRPVLLDNLRSSWWRRYRSGSSSSTPAACRLGATARGVVAWLVGIASWLESHSSTVALTDRVYAHGAGGALASSAGWPRGRVGQQAARDHRRNHFASSRRDDAWDSVGAERSKRELRLAHDHAQGRSSSYASASAGASGVPRHGSGRTTCSPWSAASPQRAGGDSPVYVVGGPVKPTRPAQDRSSVRLVVMTHRT